MKGIHLLAILVCCVFMPVSQLQAAVILGIADNEQKEGKAIVQVELMDAKSIAKNLLRYREKKPFFCPREDITPEQQASYIKQAKNLLVELHKESVALANAKEVTMATYAARDQNWVASRRGLEILGALGKPEDVVWLAGLNEHPSISASEAMAQIYSRYGLSFEHFKGEGKAKLLFAMAMVACGDKAALAYLYDRHKTDSTFSLTSVIRYLVKYRHPEASVAAKQIIQDYRELLAAGKYPFDCNSYHSAIGWAVIEIARHQDNDVDALALLDGLVISEGMASNPVLLMCLKDPRPVFDILLGAKGQVPQWMINQIARGAWHRTELYAATAGRGTEDFQAIFDHYSKLVYGIAVETNMYNTSSRFTGILCNQMISILNSGMRLSPYAASLCESYDDSINTSYRFQQAPWIKMSWLLREIVPYTGTKQRIPFSTDALSPFPHETILEAMKENTEGKKSHKDMLLLHHRAINRSFHSLNPATIGAIRNPMARLSGDEYKVAVHTQIQVVTPRKPGRLMVGFKVQSVHHDGGGLASAIGQKHLKLKALHDDSCKSQISRVRCESKSGEILPLEYVKTTSSGIHVFEGPMPAGGFRGAYLRYDWTPLHDKYPLVHALYEPWFALVP